MLAQMPAQDIQKDFPLDKLNWFKTGGCAKFFYKAYDVASLKDILQYNNGKEKIFIIGNGSNLLVRDGGIDGLVIKLGKGFSHIHIDKPPNIELAPVDSVKCGSETEAKNNENSDDGDVIITAGAAVLSYNIIKQSLQLPLSFSPSSPSSFQNSCYDDGIKLETKNERAISGMEFLANIPGSIGGMVAMNAGAYGKEISDIFVKADSIDKYGNELELHPQDMGFAYRQSNIEKHGLIITSVVLKGQIKPKKIVEENLDAIKKHREATQIQAKTGGSIFKNPSGRSSLLAIKPPNNNLKKINQQSQENPTDCLNQNNNNSEEQMLKAWQLIEKVGLRGHKIGAASICKKHCNFIINENGANNGGNSLAIEQLIKLAQQKVQAETGVKLQTELRIMGNHHCYQPDRH